MKFCIVLSALTLVSASSIFADRTRIKYDFDDYDDYVKQAGTAALIVEKDTGTDKWGCTKQLPPTCYPPPLTDEAIHDIKSLQGLEVSVIRRRKDM